MPHLQPSPDKATNRLKPSSVVDTRVIYCGDNIDQLAKFPDACVDLIYIDPPFNSNRNYEVFWGETKEKRAFEDRHASTEAYISYMRPRCEELHRTLKPSGSFYYHCDWHASHYVKVMLDQIFGEDQFINEIVWKRQTSHNDAKQGSKHYGRLHDVLLFYSGGRAEYAWNQQYVPLDQSYIDSHYSQVDEHGRRFQWGDLRAPGGAAPSKGNPHYVVLGVEGYWRYTKEKMDQFIREGRVAIPPDGRVPRYKRYLDESKGLPVGSLWDDINPINIQGRHPRKGGWKLEPRHVRNDRGGRKDINTGKDAVLRYALPNPDPACFVFTGRPDKDTDIQRGIVEPAFNQPGGGVETILPKGTQPNTVTGPVEIPKE